MPLLVVVVWKANAVAPLLQAASLAGAAENQAAQEVVTLANILVPHGQHERLLVQVVGTCLEHKLLVEDGVQVAPFDARPELPLVPIRLQLAVIEEEANRRITSIDGPLGILMAFTAYVHFHKRIREAVVVHGNEVRTLFDQHLQRPPLRVVAEGHQDLPTQPRTLVNRSARHNVLRLQGHRNPVRLSVRHLDRKERETGGERDFVNP